MEACEDVEVVGTVAVVLCSAIFQRLSPGDDGCAAPSSFVTVGAAGAAGAAACVGGCTGRRRGGSGGSDRLGDATVVAGAGAAVGRLRRSEHGAAGET